MGEKTGISWTDSTMNFWEGCTKVGPGCDHCYAATRDVRFTGGAHWGAGAPRRQMKLHTRNNPLRWQRDAAAFFAEHGHKRRVFCSSLADIFDNEVPAEWRAEAFATMEATPDLNWQLCTKRVSNVAKMAPDHWHRPTTMFPHGWPRNVGVLITTVTPEEVRRDVPRLLELKRRFGIPWVGLSIEPMIADVSVALLELGGDLLEVNWIILGGESGAHARPCDLDWMRAAIAACEPAGPAIFVKQMGDNVLLPPSAPEFTGKGADPAEWPADIRLQEFPAALA